MTASYIDYSDTHSFSATLLSYLSQDTRLESYISSWPTLKSFEHAILKGKKAINRETLASVLESQYADEAFKGDDSKVVLDNIKRLRNENTFTITTGHQLNIFTGPLYFIYKIVTAINLAKELKSAHPDKDFVPVYWMATEDHDFEEINHVKLHGKKFTWNEDTTGATGRIDPVTIRDTLKAYENALGLSENASKLCALLDEAYLNHLSLADATRYLVHNLFAKYGLVILDADNIELKKLFRGIIQDDILDQKSFSAISATSKSLKDAGYDTQVHAREINFFYLKDKLRERLVYEDERWKVINSDISFSKEELIKEIEQHPDRFSPNVVMRPLYQELILPNIAYIGGGAEIVYWLQLKANFEQYAIDFPSLVLRNSALVTSGNLSSKLGRLNLGIKEIFKTSDLIKREWVLQNSEHSLSISEEWAEIENILSRLKARAAKIDPTLAPSTEAIQTRLKKALSNLEQKLVKAEKRNHGEALSQIDYLREKYFPGNGLQERVENFGYFYSQYGEEFISGLVRHFKPLDFKFTILEP